MKVLIWIGCLTLNYIISNTASAIVQCIPASSTEGIILIGLLNGVLSAASIGFCIWLAFKLCKKWDWYRIMTNASKAGMSVSEYARHGLTEKFLEKLDSLCNSVHIAQVKPLLKELLKQKKITKDQYKIFLDEYYNKK